MICKPPLPPAQTGDKPDFGDGRGGKIKTRFLLKAIASIIGILGLLAFLMTHLSKH